MPNKPSWLLRVNDILADLARPELASVPFLSRAAIENLFGLKRRQSIQIMHAVGGFQIGKAFVVARSDLTRWLRRASLGAQVGWEQARYARVEDRPSPRSSTSARPAASAPFCPAPPLEPKLDSILPPPGELRISFHGAQAGKATSGLKRSTWRTMAMSFEL